MKVYDYSVKKVDGSEVSLKEYEGKVLLIVNTATGCGFTPQYDGLEKLYSKFKNEGFEILDFPCNQFLNQAPGTNEEIVNFCKLNFGTDFETFAKIDVNGESADPLYKFLKEE
ncbi:glutathione peroxidase, partial [Sedimentibacter sp. B4]|uniref:glutathione peroxidase n=1 Tax=Sedimentibacter sp. B4 TaxID=304766 RepID=UPI000592FCA9